MKQDKEVILELATLLAEKKALKDAEIEECIAGRLQPRELKPFNWKEVESEREKT